MRQALIILIAAGTFMGVTQSTAQLPPPPPPPPPGLPPVPVPAENPITESKRVLGKILFWEEQLSSDNTVSCGTCHRPAFGGGDPRLGHHPGSDDTLNTADDIIGSPGVRRRDINNNPIVDPTFGNNPQVTGRSAPSFFMGIFSDENFWDGRAGSTFLDPEDGVTVAIASGGALENQAVGPILSSVEMAKDGRTWADVRSKLQLVVPMALATNVPSDMAAAIQANSTYPQLFTTAFGDGNITAVRIAFAIATYERTLVADQTPWDTNTMTPQQQAGWDFLRNDTICLNCHRPPLFTDDRFHNIGLRPANEDQGRRDVTGNNGDRGDFKTPSLRNSGLKQALMHVGWITNINDAIDFYISGTTNTGHTQFTANQDNIPNGGGSYNNISIALTTPGGQPFRAAITDFLINGLTDPRVAAETFPFDRPTLASEAGAGPPPPPPGVPAMPVSSWGMSLLLMGLIVTLGSWNTLEEMRREK